MLAGLGSLAQPDDSRQPAPETEYLWPCNLKHWELWQEVSTQWRVGVSGYTGLDYAGVRAHLTTAHGLRGKKLQKAWQAMRACEEGALRAWAEDAQARQEADRLRRAKTPPGK